MALTGPALSAHQTIAAQNWQSFKADLHRDFADVRQMISLKSPRRLRKTLEIAQN